ncbi:hypothetical protein [Kosmotoga olearia]|uniref:hypothetical protein n=1 Tax=Kosmotoga olearia TaxID=651457 RepID=UPI0013052BA2|nr:hypothetical protein [Kosmotoga olearia]
MLIGIFAITFGSVIVITSSKALTINNTIERYPVPVFKARNFFKPVFDELKKKLERNRILVSVLKWIEDRQFDKLHLQISDTTVELCTPDIEIYEAIINRLVMEIGARGEKKQEYLKFFGKRYVEFSEIRLGAFIVRYIPGYIPVNEDDFDTAELPEYYVLEDDSPGKIVMSVLKGKAPIVVYSSENELKNLEATLQKYSLLALPAKDYLR